MKKTLLLFLVVALLLVACRGAERATTSEEPTAAVREVPAPTLESPKEEPAEVGGPEPGSDTIEHTPDPDLIDHLWGWGARDPNGNGISPLDVPNPEHYTLAFKEDGTFDAVLDCNKASGHYASSRAGDILIELGPSTMAACPPGSLADDMVAMLGPAQGYRLEEDGELLVLSVALGGPLYYFRRLDLSEVDLRDAEVDESTATGAVTAPAGIYLRTGPGTNYPYVGVAPQGQTGAIIGVSEDGGWWLVSAPDVQGGQVWASAQYVEVENADNVPVIAAHGLELDLEAIPWEWVSTTDPVEGPVAVTDPSRYLLRFDEDNTAYIKADCNNVQAAYTAGGSSLTVTPGPSTRSMCPADSQDRVFLQQLANVTRFFIHGGNLYLDLMADGGTMRFVPQGTPVPAPEPPAAEADANTLYLVSFGPQDTPEPIIPGSRIVASWAGERVSGFAGCNNYSGTVTPANGYFDISGVVSTRKTCPEPAGVMEQETAFLNAMETVNGYQWRSGVINGVEVVTEGQLFYTLPGGIEAVMNFTAGG